jgi:hypothetical protein
MTDMGFLEADNQRAELRQAKPVRDLTAQHATFVFGTADLALAGDDEHEGHATTVGALQEAEQRVMSTNLRHAVQIEAGINLVSSPREPGALAPAKRHQGRDDGFAGS